MPQKPNVVTQSGGNVFINAKLDRSFEGDETKAQQYAQKLLENPYQEYIMGDTGGETFRKTRRASGQTQQKQKQQKQDDLTPQPGEQDPFSDFNQAQLKTLENVALDMTQTPQSEKQKAAGEAILQGAFGKLSKAQQQLMREQVMTQTGAVASSKGTRKAKKEAEDALEEMKSEFTTTTQTGTTGTTQDAGLQDVKTATTSTGANVDLLDFGGAGQFSVPGFSGAQADPSLTPAQQRLFNETNKLLQTQHDETVEQIRQQMERDIADAKVAQKKSFGANRVALAKMGALNVTSAGAQYLTDLQTEHTQQLADITAKANSAIAEAQMALQTGKVDMLAQKISAVQQNKENLMREQQLMNQRIQTAMEITKFNRESVSASLDAAVASGMGAEQFDDRYLQSLDKQAGYVPGTSKGLLNMAVKERERQAIKDQQEAQQASFDNMSSLIDILGKVPNTESITINGATYQGMDNGLEFRGYEVDQSTGDVVSFTYDKNTNELYTQTQKGLLTPNVEYAIQEFSNRDGSTSSWYVPKDPSSGASAIPVMGGGAQYGKTGGASGGAINTTKLMQDYPNNESFSYNEDGTPRSWCLEWIREISDDGVLPPPGTMDSIDQKAAYADPTIGFGEDSIRTPQAGDYIMTNEDTRYGHIALISEVRTNPNTGEQEAILAESNYTPGKVQYGRRMLLTEENMASNGGKIMGFRQARLKDRYQSETRGANQYAGGFQLGDAPDPTDGAIIFEQQDKLRKEFLGRPEISSFQEVAAQFDNIQAAITNPENAGQDFMRSFKSNQAADLTDVDKIGGTAAGDLALIFSFMKMLDPSSVVREGEFATAQNAGGVGERIRARYNSVLEGDTLSAKQRADFVRTAQNQFTERKQRVQPVIEEFRTRAEERGLNFEDIAPSSITTEIGQDEIPTTINPYNSFGEMRADFPELSDAINQAQSLNISVGEFWAYLNEEL